MTSPVHVVLAGGGSAGHISPALAVADALRRLEPETQITALGTSRGLETTLIPAEGHRLELIPAVPMPRKPTMDLLRVPGRLGGAVRDTKEILDRVNADVVIGFGGYVSLPAYLAARGRYPMVVFNLDVHPGLANRIGARFTRNVAVGAAGCQLPHARVVGVPIRTNISTLNRDEMREKARLHFDLDPDTPTLLVFGGSQGARSLNNAVSAAADELTMAGVQVLHVAGKKNTVTVNTRGGARYQVVPYVDRMDLAYAAADFALCRSGANTCAELTAVGLPAAYVPLPLRGGEARLNAEPIAQAGGGLLIDDASLSPEWIIDEIIPVLANSHRLTAMSQAARQLGHRDADLVLAEMVLEAARA